MDIERTSRTLAQFDALKPGQTLTVVGDRDLKLVLRRLQVERAMSFDWNVLDATPGQVRVEVVRRKAKGPADTAEYFRLEHERLEALLLQTSQYVNSRGFAEARQRFVEARSALDRRVLGEETILFPVFEKLTGTTRGPTALMRWEHSQIRSAAAAVALAIVAEDVLRATTEIRSFAKMYRIHNLNEEEKIYRRVDLATVGKGKKYELICRLQAV